MDEATIRNAVYDWIKDDCGQGLKMAMGKSSADLLVARILAAQDEYNERDDVKINRAVSAGELD